MKFNSNLTSADKTTIKKFKQMSNEIIIKPADKNLGIVLLTTDDYIAQCTKHLSDKYLQISQQLPKR